MNERIRQLAEQAGFLNKDEESIEYFAQLIVKECLDILDDEDNGELDARSVRIAAIRIKKHFGVKE
jgi:hypothetical protein